LSRVPSQYFFDRYPTVCAGRRGGTEQGDLALFACLKVKGVALKTLSRLSFSASTGCLDLLVRAELAFTED
jgi:hypothetical protein